MSESPICSCCKSAHLVVKRYKIKDGWVALGLCPDCDVRVCHYGATPGDPRRAANVGCQHRVEGITTKRCPVGHPL